MNSALYIMMGGFLGAGKTTAVGQLARWLTDRGKRVGLITNDQASGLVDSANLRAQGYAVEEIAGGCFCCRFDSLLDAARSLSASDRPDVFLAEPVGSCTDLVATVSYPLRRIYGDEFRIAPLSVLVDPTRAERVLGLSEGRGFSTKVVYIFEKQLEEADVIVVNKVDQLEDDRRERLVEALEARFPETTILCASARDGAGLEEWFDVVNREGAAPSSALDIDYDIYAEGEALLGWLNATLRFAVDPPQGKELDGNRLIEGLATGMRARLDAADAEIAHLKMTLVPRGHPLGEIAVVSLVRNDFVPEVCQQLVEAVEEGEIVINLRAEADPEKLREIVEAALVEQAGAVPGLTLETVHLENFRPGRPVPTHRMTGDVPGESSRDA